MVEITLKTNQGDQVCETSGVKTPRAEPGPVRRVSVVDLDGPLGQFLAEVLCEIAPNAFHANNWKGKLSTFLTSKTSSFIVCGRAVGLAHLNQDPMTGIQEARVMFCIVADGGSEEDGYQIIRTMKLWSRDMGMGMVLPPKEYCNLPPGKLANTFKAEKREEWVLAPPVKK